MSVGAGEGDGGREGVALAVGRGVAVGVDVGAGVAVGIGLGVAVGASHLPLTRMDWPVMGTCRGSFWPSATPSVPSIVQSPSDRGYTRYVMVWTWLAPTSGHSQRRSVSPPDRVTLAGASLADPSTYASPVGMVCWSSSPVAAPDAR